MNGPIILGAGATGLGAGMVTGAPVFERSETPGGICTSYYMTPGGERRFTRRTDEEDFRFEIGGGHWIFGGDPEVRTVFDSFADFGSYQRRAAVYLPEFNTYIPYPLQEHLDSLPEGVAASARRELARTGTADGDTMDAWMRAAFGDTLYDLFFGPFNALYTGGLYTEIAPQDTYKTPPVSGGTQRTGYNAEFIYPADGLDGLFRGIAARCDVRYGMNAVRIDAAKKMMYFENGDEQPYESLISTLPLHTMLALTGLDPGVPADPHTSVLVLNAAARRGPACPDAHWVYLPHSKGGFHRVGFYDNVDEGFLPQSMRGSGDVASMYIEKTYPGGYRPTQDEVVALTALAEAQLREWGIAGEFILVDPTYIATAYTWRRPGSDWRERALALLESHGIRQTGRFARWNFQGISASFKEGMHAGREAMP